MGTRMNTADRLISSVHEILAYASSSVHEIRAYVPHQSQMRRAVLRPSLYEYIAPTERL